ncbi:MAG: OmpA family protein [Ferrovibrio sp.]|nr:OmpA family protein [Ferrovibrio sp.]
MNSISNVHGAGDWTKLRINIAGPDAPSAAGAGSQLDAVLRLVPNLNTAGDFSDPIWPRQYAGLEDVLSPSGAFNNWTPYRHFEFDENSAELRPSAAQLAADITAHLTENPTARLAIDGSSNMKSAEWRSLVLRERRVEVVRDALIQAGIPAFKIQVGAFGDPDLRRENQVEVLLITVR